MSISKWMFAVYTLAAGVLMSVFILSTGVFRYVFSLGAIMIGVQLFKREEEKKPRIWFVVLVLLLALFLPLVYVLFAVAYGWPVNPEYLKE